MGKYEQDARLLLEYVGGKENIAAVSHCVSRMRFVLNDPAKADVAKIESLKSAKGTFTQAGQFQVIIGNTVNDFYNDFIAVSGIDGVSKDAVKSAAKQNQNALQRIMSVLAEIFAPLIPAIITGGLILGFRNCIDSIYLFGNGTQTLCDISQFWSGVDSFLWLIGEAIFHMLPVCICWSVTKKMGTTQSLGIVLGLTLVSGQLLNAYAVASTAAADIPKWDFGFFTINMIGYQAQVIPAMLAAFTLVYLERLFRKICPPVVSMIVVPFCSLVPSVIIAHTVLGPIGWKIGSIISEVVYAGISGSFRVVFGAIFGFVYAPLVITGLHHMSNAIDMQLIADFGGTMLWPMIALSNIAQGSAVMGMIILQKKNVAAQEVNVPAGISCYLGVTEPAIFGVNLRFFKPFIAGCIGGGCGALYASLVHLGAKGTGVTGIFGILLCLNQPLQYVIEMAIAVGVAFAVSFALYKDKKKEPVAEAPVTVAASVEETDSEESAASETKTASGNTKTTSSEEVLNAPVNGKIIPNDQIADDTFAAEVLGKTVAIEPADGIITAPCDGEIVSIFDTGHAVCILTDGGAELLIHVGIDTVKMDGNGFTKKVSDGAKVHAGDELIEADLNAIKEAGHPATTMMILTNTDLYDSVECAAPGTVTGKSSVMKLTK